MNNKKPLNFCMISKFCHSKNNLLILFNWLKVVLGCFISSFGIYYFFIPMKLAPGGVAGTASILSVHFGISAAFTIATLNSVLLCLAYKILGKDFVCKTIFGVACLTLWLLFHELTTKYFPICDPKNLFADKLLSCIFGGITTGLGMGIVLSANGSTGGNEIAARLFCHLGSRLTIPQWIFVIDSFVIASGAILSKSVEVGLYSILSMIVCCYMVDLILTGINKNAGIYIVSQNSSKIAEKILANFDQKSMTFWQMHSPSVDQQNILFCVLPFKKLCHLKCFVLKEDPTAFMTTIPVKDVLGNVLYSPNQLTKLKQEKEIL